MLLGVGGYCHLYLLFFLTLILYSACSWSWFCFVLALVLVLVVILVLVLVLVVGLVPGLVLVLVLVLDLVLDFCSSFLFLCGVWGKGRLMIVWGEHRGRGAGGVVINVRLEKVCFGFDVRRDEVGLGRVGGWL